jgi:general secretion pathway protein F
MFTNPQYMFAFYLALLVASIAGLFALRLASKHEIISSQWAHWVILLGCWAILVGGLAGAIANSPVAVFGLLLSIAVLGIIILVPACILVNVAVRPNYRSEQNALLWSLTVAAEKMVPLVPTIEAFARESTGQMPDKARRLAKLLDSGIPLPQALDRVPGILPARVLPMIRVGYDSGVLAKALRQAVSTRDMLNVVWSSFFGKVVYVAAVATFASGILAFTMVKIVPSYERIFWDFKQQLPGVTKALMAASHYVVEGAFIFLPLYLLFIGLLIYFVLAYLGAITFSSNQMSGFLRRRHTAMILDSLALAAETARPMSETMLTLAGVYPQSGIRRKISYAAVDIHQGMDWCDSLYRHGLLKKADRAVLQAAQRVGNLPWAMREMADSNRRRLAYRLNALVQLAYPPVILCVGFCVMFIVVALFYPVITLISRLAGG